VEAGAVKATLAWPDPAVAAPMVGAPGTVVVLPATVMLYLNTRVAVPVDVELQGVRWIKPE